VAATTIELRQPTGADHAIDILTTRFIGQPREEHGMEKPRTRRLLALPLIVSGAALLPTQSAVSTPQDPDRAGCVEHLLAP